MKETGVPYKRTPQKGPRKRKPRTATEKLANNKYNQARYREAKNDPLLYLKNSLKFLKYRAKKAGLPFDLDPEWLEMQPMQCAATGIKFAIPPSGVGPATPSFDQKTPKGGYTKENTQIVCYWYNCAKGPFPDETIRALIREAAPVV